MKQLLNKAITLAAQKHDGQFDKAGQPYILHLMTVLTLTNSQDEEVQCIAVLHDIIEDTKTTYRELVEHGFSIRVIQGVQALTKQPGQTYDEYKDAVKSNPDAILVKLADLEHNSDIRRLKGVSEKDIQRTAKYHQFYQELKLCMSQN